MSRSSRAEYSRGGAAVGGTRHEIGPDGHASRVEHRYRVDPYPGLARVQGEEHGVVVPAGDVMHPARGERRLVKAVHVYDNDPPARKGHFIQLAHHLARDVCVLRVLLQVAVEVVLAAITVRRTVIPALCRCRTALLLVWREYTVCKYVPLCVEIEDHCDAQQRDSNSGAKRELRSAISG